MKKRCPAFHRHAQVSMEYLLVMAFAMLITIPIVIAFFANTAATGEQVDSSQARQAARKIIDASESVYYLGEPSSTTLRVYIPSRAESINVSGRELSFRIRTSAGYSDVVVLSAVNITGNITPGSGVRSIRIEATGGGVAISSP